MLLTKNLIEGVDEKYIPMLKMVNIPDFTKCIAEFSGISVNFLKDDVIKNYLLTWTKNKYRFFEMLGGQLKIDNSFVYKKIRDNIREEIEELGMSFPAYALWLDSFRRLKANSIVVQDLDWSMRDKLFKLFPQCKLDGCSITHFFKKMLNAPDELITKIAAIFENDIVEATHTISIDPVDMMLASENPYDWESCYRLETNNRSSHADGCLAAVLDTTSLITYVWNHEGKMNIYGEYDFKNVRYKRMRQWIAISKSFSTIHFNTIYPGKDYEDNLQKDLREIVERTVSNYLGLRNMWKPIDRDCGVDTCRTYQYGYSEFRSSYMFHHSDLESEDIDVYDIKITCPCGCGEELTGSDEGVEYIGEGFTCTGYEDRYWCEYLDDYCDCGECCEENCYDCDIWRDNHPVCSLDTDEECDDPDWRFVDDGVCDAHEHSCRDCPIWKRCHKEDEDENEDGDRD